MTAATLTTTPTDRGWQALRIGILLSAFAVAVALRVAVGGVGVAQSASAGWVFAGCLLLLSFATGTTLGVTRRALPIGLVGAAVICAPVLLPQLLSGRPLHSAAGFSSWAVVVVVVATAEELFLRGALYDAVNDLAGTPAAVAVGAICFAALHVPLYGWHVLPLDLAVGVVLGGLRQLSGTPAAPAVAHVSADMAGWFLR